jgi:flagella basal body P-ring formation protein FlgA
MLVARGVNVGELSFSGSNQVTVETPVETPVVVVAPQPIERGPVTPPLQMVNEALLNYLRQATSSDQAWNFQFQLPTTTAQALRRAVETVSISGGTSPWLGAQEFTLHILTAEGEVQLPLDVEISVPHAVVAVVRAMPRGSILRAEDVKLVEQLENEQIVHVEEAFHTLEDVIGKETQKAISPGQVLDKNYVRSQILVRRGDVVTVYARAAGIRVRTSARALSDGSKGDLIAVETLETGSRDKFDARVTGAQVVEVWAGSIAAGGK